MAGFQSTLMRLLRQVRHPVRERVMPVLDLAMVGGVDRDRRAKWTRDHGAWGEPVAAV